MPLEFTVDPRHGARITSLRGPDGHEWLWRRDAPERDLVGPGDAFVDAGGLEECFPTVSGVPDHGDVWSQPWQSDGAGLSVAGSWYRLHRTLASRSDTLTATYRLEAEPGRRFIWAAHALLDLSLDARIEAPARLPIEVDAGDGLLDATWPRGAGLDLDRVGPVDGSAAMVFLPFLDTIEVRDDDHFLRMSLHVTGQPYAVGIWRNLGGWPEGNPYRSIGVEPMLGRRTGLATAPEGQAAQVPSDGVVEWTMDIVAGSR